MIIYPTETIVTRVQGDVANIMVGPLLVHDSEGNEYGGGPKVSGQVTAQSLWRRNERRRYEYFMRLYKNGDTLNMKREFGTTDPKIAVQLINAELLADPRLDVMTRRGPKQISVTQQALFGALYAAPESCKK